jgi:hypothetical protein
VTLITIRSELLCIPMLKNTHYKSVYIYQAEVERKTVENTELMERWELELAAIRYEMVRSRKEASEEIGMFHDTLQKVTKFLGNAEAERQDERIRQEEMHEIIVQSIREHSKDVSELNSGMIDVLRLTRSRSSCSIL